MPVPIQAFCSDGLKAVKNKTNQIYLKYIPKRHLPAKKTQCRQNASLCTGMQITYHPELLGAGWYTNLNTNK